MDIARVKEAFFDQGYSIVEDAVEAEMLDRLESGARNVWGKVRSAAVAAVHRPAAPRRRLQRHREFPHRSGERRCNADRGGRPGGGCLLAAYLLAGSDTSGHLSTYRINAQGRLEALQVYDLGMWVAWMLPVKISLRSRLQSGGHYG